MQVGEETMEFKQLPGALGVANYGNGTTVVTDSKDLMFQEVQNLISNSRQVIESVPYHETVVQEGEKILKDLSADYS